MIVLLREGGNLPSEEKLWISIYIQLIFNNRPVRLEELLPKPSESFKGIYIEERILISSFGMELRSII